MLSYILGIAFRFEREHGYAPNLVYVNREHLLRLYDDLGMSEVLELSETLGMVVMVYPGIVHPQVLYLHKPRIASAGH